MNLKRRDFLLLVTLVAAAATSAFGANCSACGRAGRIAKQSAASIPDFSGIWGHQYLPALNRRYRGLARC